MTVCWPVDSVVTDFDAHTTLGDPAGGGGGGGGGGETGSPPHAVRTAARKNPGPVSWRRIMSGGGPGCWCWTLEVKAPQRLLTIYPGTGSFTSPPDLRPSQNG